MGNMVVVCTPITNLGQCNKVRCIPSSRGETSPLSETTPAEGNAFLELSLTGIRVESRDCKPAAHLRLSVTVCLASAVLLKARDVNA